MKKLIAVLLCSIPFSTFTWNWDFLKPNCSSWYQSWTNLSPNQQNILIGASTGATLALLYAGWSVSARAKAPVSVVPPQPSPEPLPVSVSVVPPQPSPVPFSLPIYNSTKFRTEADARKKGEKQYLQYKIAITVLSDHGETPEAIEKQLPATNFYFVCPASKEGASYFRLSTRTIMNERKVVYPTLTLMNWHTSQQKEEHYNTETKTWQRIRYQNLPELPDLD